MRSTASPSLSAGQKRKLSHAQQDDIDPQLRLRTVRTAASSIAEAGRVEDRTSRRKARRSRSRRFFRRTSEKRRQEEDSQLASRTSSQAPAPTVVPGERRNVYVNIPLAGDEVDAKGEPLVRYVRNKVRTSSAYRRPIFRWRGAH